MGRRVLGAVVAALVGTGAMGAGRPPEAGGDGRAHAVPYRLTDLCHVLVRARVNGRGPYHLIVDTGAPVLVLSRAVGGWVGLERLELEGGLAIDSPRALVSDTYQVEGMNQLALSGVELHGIIGYTIMARYRVMLDLGWPSMVWTEIDHDPPPPESIATLPLGLSVTSGALRVALMFAEVRPPPALVPRGSVGLELEESDGGVRVARVHRGRPADRAGIRTGDRISRWMGRPVRRVEEVLRVSARLKPGTALTVDVVRGGRARRVMVKASQGL